MTTENLPLRADEEVPLEQAQGEEENSINRQVVKQLEEEERNFEVPDAQAGGAPHWVKLPQGFSFPRGKQILFVRFKSKWTDAPWIGSPMLDPNTGETEKDSKGREVLYRQCVLWPINVADKKFALARAQRDANRVAEELAKQMVRIHDGKEADWSVVRADGVEMFWNELGERCRQLLIRLFNKLHVLDSEEQRDFLQNCIEVRSTGS